MLSAAIAVAAYANRDVLAIKIKSVYVRVAPKASIPQRTRAPNRGAFSGDAPWALSALPECFTQASKTTSPQLQPVLQHLPKGATMVRPPADLRYADCTLLVRGDVIYVRRGGDRMRVPPAARLYVSGNGLALLRSLEGGYELRVYRTASRGEAAP